VHISAKCTDLNISIITATTTTPTTTIYGKGREMEEPLRCRGKGGKSNSWHCCLSCWCNDVIAVM